jgi:hypothetical protein
MAQRRSKMSKKEFDDQFEAFLKEVWYFLGYIWEWLRKMFPLGRITI